MEAVAAKLIRGIVESAAAKDKKSEKYAFKHFQLPPQNFSRQYNNNSQNPENHITLTTNF